MPKYTIETAERKAESLVEPFIRNGLNESKTARELGVTSQAINQRLKHKPVQDALQRYINSPKLKAKLIKVSEEALKAKIFTKKGSKPDHDARHKYWHDLLTAGGILKNTENGKGGNQVIIIKISSSNSFITPEEQEAINGKKDNSQ